MTGAIVLSTDQGLGYLAKSFYDHGVIQRVLIKPHSTRTNNTYWYGKNDWRWLFKDNYDWFFQGLKSILFFEEPFDWHLIPEARKRQVKTVFIPMYECTRYPFPYEPDLILAPSALDAEFYKKKNPKPLPIPVEEEWKLRTKAKIFVHNAGNGGLGGRNGTRELLEAMQFVQSPVKLIIRTQALDFQSSDPRVEIRKGTFDHKELYAEGDVFIFPEKFNGLSLPLQEAYASGMGIMCTNRFPMNTWLPTDLMIPVKGYKPEKISVEFQSAIIDPKDIAQTIDAWFDRDISNYSRMGKAWGEAHSWEKLKPHYARYL